MKMKRNQPGYTFIELAVSIAIIALVSTAASLATFQIFKGTERNNQHLTVVRQVQNAGYWISRDAQMAQTITTDNLTLPDFLVIVWTEWDGNGDPIYFKATYYFEDLVDTVGKLKRSYWSSTGANQQTLIAERIYYDPADPTNTTRASYQSPSLTVQLTALFGDSMESQEYLINHRPDL